MTRAVGDILSARHNGQGSGVHDSLDTLSKSQGGGGGEANEESWELHLDDGP